MGVSAKINYLTKFYGKDGKDAQLLFKKKYFENNNKYRIGTQIK